MTEKKVAAVDPETPHEAPPPSPKADAHIDNAAEEARGYRTEERFGAAYFVTEDGYASFDESYVREYVASQRQARAAQELAKSTS